MAKVNFIRRHTDAEVDEEPIVDGNFIVTGDGNIYIDYGLERIKIVGGGGGNATGDTLPIGSITAYGKETAPANWLICDGSAVSRTSYADLFAVIGTKYGEGDGITTFNLPNLKGRVPVGLDSSDTDFNTIGMIGGEKTHTLTIDEMPNHKHLIYQYVNGYKLGVVTEYGVSGGKTISMLKNSDKISDQSRNSGDTSVGLVNADYTGDSQPHNNLQPYQVQNYIIKAFQSAGVVANVVDNLTSTSASDALSANQGKVLNDKINANKPSIITAGASTNQVVTNDSTTRIVNLDKILSQNGNKFELSNKGIKIGAGVTKVKISANCLGYTNTTSLCGINISKNGITLNDTLSVGFSYTQANFEKMTLISLAPIIVDVVEGDIIYLVGYVNSGGIEYTLNTYAGRAVNLTIEEVIV